ncbi:hypothetical protein GUJ93_ZPchr0010g8396 [Zizania palustris]|uniref:Uncharacterized protein n=1 Tax=Zizania palustris TaxID=103762 RepID=A0A8J5WDT1_ZIZPA|nr:hypothetical protein GUJ93_ZPchr0010g8396 [Zizania palustris]
MSTAVVRGMMQAEHGFRGAGGKGKGAAAVEEEDEEAGRNSNGFFVDEEEVEVRGAMRGQEEGALSDTSSIGAPSSDNSSIGENSSSEKAADGEEEEGEEVESKVKEEGGLGIHGLGTLESLEDALPIKRGLSNFYAGKSKSFTSLAEAAAKAAAKEIAKPENPFNKRRRVLAAWSRRHASCSSLVTAYLPPLLSLDHTVVEEDDEEDSDTEQCSSNSNNGARRRQEPTFPPPRLSLHAQRSTLTARSPNATTSSSFRSPRSFSLSDLQNAG